MQIIDHPIPGLRFIIHNQEAQDWYNPPKPYTVLEYEWVRDNLVIGNNTLVVDAGCHHGHYSLVFKPAYVLAVDCDPDCVTYTKHNLELNNMVPSVYQWTLGETHGFPIPMADIYKCDIEGAEFEIFPRELERFPDVHTWIIEIHPNKGKPDDIIQYFKDFHLLKVDRERMEVRPYRMGETWRTHATLIAVKDSRRV